MSRSTVRSVFLVVFTGLFIQHGLVGIVGYYASEPWPAIVLPAFKHVQGSDGTVKSRDHHIDVLLEDGEQLSFERPAFMNFMPIIHQSAFLKHQCQPASLSGTEKTEACTHPDGKELFTDRARELTSNREIKRVDIVWKRLRVDVQNRTPQVIPLDTLRLDP